MIRFLTEIKKGFEDNNESDKYINEKFEEKQKEIEKVLEESDKIQGKISRTFMNIVNATPNKLVSDGIKKILKDFEEKKSTVTLEDIANDYKELEEKILLDEKQVEAYKEIKEAVKDPTKYKDELPPSDLNADKINSIFGTTGISASEIHESK